MFILLTDALTCPRCGPDFGLIVQADRLEARRVMQGRLGCSNCRETYLVRGGAAYLTPGAGPDEAPAADASSTSGDDQAEAAVRLAALMGLAGANGLVMIAGPGARHAAAVSALVPDVEVVGVTSTAAGEPEAGVSRIVTAHGLPVRGGAMRGAALTGGGAGEAELREGLRVLAPGARLVVDPAPAGTGDLLRGLSAEVVLDQEGVVVARARGRPVPLRPGPGR